MLTAVPLCVPLFTVALVHGWYIFRGGQGRQRSVSRGWPLRRDEKIGPLERFDRTRWQSFGVEGVAAAKAGDALADRHVDGPLEHEHEQVAELRVSDLVLIARLQSHEIDLQLEVAV